MENKQEGKTQIESNLQDLGIYQLRNLARQVGVAVPTTLKRAELIQKITAIVNGEEAPIINRSKRGRPTKYPDDLKLLTSLDVGSSDYVKKEVFHPIPYPALASFESVKLKELENGEKMVRSGYISVEKEGHAVFFNVPQEQVAPIYIKREFIVKYGLRDGDAIEAEIIKAPNVEPLVSGILKVNGKENRIEKSNFYDFVNSERFDSDKTFLWENDSLGKFYSKFIPAYLGDRIMVKTVQEEYPYMESYEFIKQASQNEYISDIVVLGVNCAEELIHLLRKTEKVTCITSRFGDDVEYQKLIVSLAFKRALNLAGIKGKNVLYVAIGLQDILALFDGEERKNTLYSFKKFFSYSKQAEYSSLTVAYFAKDDNILKEFSVIQNIKLEYLPLKYLTKSRIKYNLINSFRQELFLPSIQRLNLRQAVSSFLEKIGDYDLLENLVSNEDDEDKLIEKLNQY